MNNAIDRAARILAIEARLLVPVQSVVLLLIRLYWGWEFIVTGYGHLTHIPKVIGFFTSLGIPMPVENAWIASCTELFGGIALLIGLGGRVATIPLVFTMCIAYLTSDRDALNVIFSDPDTFTGATPFLFWAAALLVLVFGAGELSVDGLIARWYRASRHLPKQPAT